MSHSSHANAGSRKRFAFVTHLALVLLVGGTVASADTFSDLRNQQDALGSGRLGAVAHTQGMHELTELRRMNSNTYDVGDGQQLAVITIHPQYFVAPDGNLVPINTRVVRSNGNDAAYENTTNILQTSFARSSAQVTATAGGATLQYEPVATRMSDSDRGQILGRARAVTANGSRNVVEYDGALPDIDVRYTVKEGGVIQDFILNRLPSLPGSMFAEDAMFEIGEELVITGGSLENVNGDVVAHGTETSGALMIRSDGQTMRLAAPFAQEEITGAPAQTDAIPGSYRVDIGPDGTVILWTRIPYAWLADPAREYPVIIDPSLDLQPDAAAGKDSQLLPFSGASNWGTRQFLTDNWGTQDARGIIEFDLSSIPAGSSVSSATLTLWHHWNVEFTSMDLHANSASWNENTVTWNNAPGHAAVATDGHVPGVGNMQFEDWNVTSDVSDFVNGTSSNYGWTLKSSGANMTAYYFSSDAPLNFLGVPNGRPHLVVLYDAGGGGGDCDLAPIEAKLDDETRFTDDDELAEAGDALVGAIDAAIDAATARIQADIAMLEAKADAAGMAHDELLALGEVIRMSIIEHDLAQEKEGSKLMALTCLPGAEGGNLEETRALVLLRINSLEAAGCDARSLDQARAELATGDGHYALGAWIRACDMYAKAYHTAGVHCP